MALYVLMTVLGVVLLAGIVIYNKLVRRKHHVFEAWSGIDVQLKRRHDLLPKLIEAVKGYVRHERETLERLTAQRVGADAAARAASETALSQGLRQLFAVAENYPELKANENFLSLQRSLSEVEEQIQYARRYYNATVRELNVLVQSFPSRLVAGLFSFREAEYFNIELATQRESPELRF